MRIRDLIPEEELNKECELLSEEVERCASDYRKADKRTLLFLLPGVNFNTYNLVDYYIKSSALAIVSEDRTQFPADFKSVIEVKNARRSFAFAMSKISEIDYGSISFIGVTGTNGKTSCATMIYSVLTDASVKCGFIGTGKMLFGGASYCEKNYSMTSPDPDVLYPTIKKMQNDGCSCIVIEASSHALSLEKLAPIPFKIGIFTGLSHEHLDFHGNMKNYFEAKERLIASCESAIINYDDEWGKKLYEKYEKKSTSVAIIGKSDCHAEMIESLGIRGTKYLLRKKNLSTKINLALPGIYNVYNSALAFEACYKYNIPLNEIKKSLESISCIDGRFETFVSDITVIIDYAHTPLALEMLLKTTNNIKKAGQKITLVFGCGGERDASKRPLMAKAAENGADKIIVTNDNPRNEDENKIVSDILSGFKDSKHGVILDRKSAIEYAIASASAADIVIIAGKGHEKYVSDKSGIHDFDEKSIVLNSLKLRKKD